MNKYKNYSHEIIEVGNGMLTIDQIRAARALLDWSQQDLAEHASLSQTGIARIENGTNKPNSKTLTKIESAFDRNQIEFIPGGVRRRKNEILILKGLEGFESFAQDVYETVRTTDFVTCLSNIDEHLFDKYFSQIEFPYLDNMNKLKEQKDFVFNILLDKNNDHHIAQYATYRSLDGNLSDTTPFYVYGEKMAIILFENDITISVINNRDIADAQRKQFKLLWENAKELE